MGKPKILYLTGVAEVLKKEAEERANAKEMPTMFEDLTCEHGRRREDYESLGIKIPQDLIDKEKEFDLDEEFEDDDFEIISTPCLIFKDEIVGVLELENVTKIYTKNSLIFSVQESVETVYQQIYFLEQTWLELQISRLKTIISKNKHN